MSKSIPLLAIDDITQGESVAWNTHDYYVTEGRVDNFIRYFPLRQNCYMISICTSGFLKIRINGEEAVLEVSTLATFTPATIIEVIEMSKDYRCHLVIFIKSFLTETLSNIYFLERFYFLNNIGLFNFKLENKMYSNLLSEINGIIDRQKEKTHPFRRDIIRNLIIILLYETENILQQQSLGQNLENSYGKEKVFSDFKELLHKKFYMERKVAYYSNKLNVTTQVLTKIVTEYTGRGAKEHIEEMVLSQAKVFLKSGNYNVSETASMLYYSNLEEFSRFFKKKTGLTPLKFSKK
ncbi:helix-turn-helix domain-containing protein [Flavobacterium panacagri]|uniref:helix-turn-helix domain-containing protein n=1 Tax=Flavobacterium panacagri TaxID=3034146 RepID=UPI0025A66415|nr:helix-turn-helix domain-containing protein [Flavobacterium panacagri]